MAKQLVWLITGTSYVFLHSLVLVHESLTPLFISSGLGRDLALAALKRGDKVIATGRARSIQKLEDLKREGADTLELDVTSPLETLNDVTKRAVAIHKRIDVLVNNAGYILVGAIEENTYVQSYNFLV